MCCVVFRCAVSPVLGWEAKNYASGCTLPWNSLLGVCCIELFCVVRFAARCVVLCRHLSTVLCGVILRWFAPL